MPAADLLQPDALGLACSPGGFHIDPWGACPVAVITHAHGDHARAGAGVYYCAKEGSDLLAKRLPSGSRIVPLEFGEPIGLGGVRVSLHPAGHVRGSAQVRVEDARGHVWVASGDYKRQPDATCSPFEVVRCDVFITEATFAMPIYRWRETAEEVTKLARWWAQSRAEGKSCVVFSYALGKAQRLLSELWQLGAQPEFAWMREETVLLHGAVAGLTRIYRDAGVPMLATATLTEADDQDHPNDPKDAGGLQGAPIAGVRPKGRSRRSLSTPCLAIAPPSAAGSTWMSRFGAPSRVETGFASGWMQLRGIRKRRGHDRGFVISDHADSTDLVRTIRETGARRVLATHGSTETLATYVRECMGIDASPLGLADATFGAEE
jgi:putative mRNA 3-end processing factor